MKKLYALSTLLLLSSCTDGRLHVDMQTELSDRPTVTLTTETGTTINGYEGPFCTDVVCFEKPDPDYAALTYTPYSNGDNLTFNVEWTKDTINTISAKMINKAGEVFHRELSYTQIDSNTFLFEDPFPTEEKDFTLYINVDFVKEGKSQYFFPLELK